MGGAVPPAASAELLLSLSFMILLKKSKHDPLGMLSLGGIPIFMRGGKLQAERIRALETLAFAPRAPGDASGACTVPYENPPEPLVRIPALLPSSRFQLFGGSQPRCTHCCTSTGSAVTEFFLLRANILLQSTVLSAARDCGGTSVTARIAATRSRNSWWRLPLIFSHPSRSQWLLIYHILCVHRCGCGKLSGAPTRSFHSG